MTATDDPSGALTAQAAHEAGAVQEIVRLPHFDVEIHFTIEGDDEADVKEKLVPLVTDLLTDDSVLDAAFTVTAA